MTGVSGIWLFQRSSIVIDTKLSNFSQNGSEIVIMHTHVCPRQVIKEYYVGVGPVKRRAEEVALVLAR